jgi:hypothetical protein
MLSDLCRLNHLRTAADARRGDDAPLLVGELRVVLRYRVLLRPSGAAGAVPVMQVARALAIGMAERKQLWVSVVRAAF